MRRRIGLAGMAGAFVLLALPSTATASDATEYHVRQDEALLNTQVASPRVKGLGGSYAAINDGANSTYENPAALGAQTSKEVTANAGYGQIDGGGKHTGFTTFTVGGSFNINSKNEDYYPSEKMGNQTVGVAYNRADAYTGHDSELESGANTAILGYGRTFGYGNILGGLSLGITKSDAEADNSYNRDMWQADLKAGTIVRLTRKFNVGGIFRYGFGNADTEYVSNQDKFSEDPSQWEARLGTSYQLSDRTLLASDLSASNVEMSGEDDYSSEHQIYKWSAGAEYALIPESVTLRGGLLYKMDDWKTNDDSAYESTQVDGVGCAFGMSYYHKYMSVEYGAEVMACGDWSHMISFSINF